MLLLPRAGAWCLKRLNAFSAQVSGQLSIRLITACPLCRHTNRLTQHVFKVVALSQCSWARMIAATSYVLLPLCLAGRCEVQRRDLPQRI